MGISYAVALAPKMERFLLSSNVKRSRNCSLVPSENENINVNLPDVENVSDVDSETEESADAFAADAETAASRLQLQVPVKLATQGQVLRGLWI